MYGVRHMDADTYDKEFKPWYKQLVAENQSDWGFRDAMVKYCRADVELLSKAVLSFRNMFKDRLDIDPFRYVTLASLCMAIFRGCFLPDKSIVANEQNKTVSKVCKEWLLYLNDDNMIPEVPIFLDKSSLTLQDLHLYKLNEDKTEYYKGDRHIFTVDAVCKKRKLIN